MTQKAQKRIVKFYSLWLFAVFILISGYMLINGLIFMEYAEAAPWIYGYLGIAVLGNVVALIGTAIFLKITSAGIKWFILYEILFIAVLVIIYSIISKEMLPEALGNINFPTLLNMVLPLAFTLLMLIEFAFSKAVKAMSSKSEQNITD